MLYEIRFKCPCPNIDCPNPNKLSSWTHSGCSGELYINKYGMINCKKCGDDCHAFDSKFKCSDEENFWESNIKKIYVANAAVGQMDGLGPEISEFYNELSDLLCEERKNRKKDNDNNNNYRKSLYLID